MNIYEEMKVVLEVNALSASIETYSLDEKILDGTFTYGRWTQEWWNYIINLADPGDNDFIFQEEDIDAGRYGNILRGGGVEFGVTSFFNLDVTPTRYLKLNSGTAFLLNIDSQLVYNIKGQGDENVLQNRVNYYVGSARNRSATIREEGGTITLLEPERIYQNFEMNFTPNLTKRVKVNNVTQDLFLSQTKIDSDSYSQTPRVQVATGGDYSFIKPLQEGKYEIITYAEMNEDRGERVFKPQARITLEVN
jgi:hypothetical protein